MKRKFLEDLGLEKEAIDEIMRENGKDIEKTKEPIGQLQEDVKRLEKTVGERDGQLETLKESSGDVEELNQKIIDLQASNTEQAEKHAADFKKLKIETALSSANAKNVKAAYALLGLDEITIKEDGTLDGFDDQLKALTESEDSKFMFEAVSKPKLRGAEPGDTSHELGDEPIKVEDMSYEELAAYLIENPEANID